MRLTLCKFNDNRSKKLMLAISLIILAIFSCCMNIVNVHANNENYASNTTRISQVVDEIIKGIDLSELDNIVNELNTVNLFDGGIKDKISKIING